MGKKSKICKVGNTKKNYGNVMKIKKEKLRNLQNIAKKMNLAQGIADQTNNKINENSNNSSGYSSNSNLKANKSIMMNTTFANHDRTNLYDTLINLNQTSDKLNLTQLNQTFLDYARTNNLNKTKLHHTMADFALKAGEVPLRNRRVKTNSVLSKGQRKRLEKKEKLLKKKLLDEVLRKNKSLIINNKSVLNKSRLNMTNILNSTNAINYNNNNNEMLIDGVFGDEKKNNHKLNKTLNLNVNKTINNNINNNNIGSNIAAAAVHKKSEFDLLEMNNTLNNMLKDIKQQDNNLEIEKKAIELTKRKKQNVKRLL